MATTDELKQYYADLLILQYRGKRNAPVWSALTTYGAGAQVLVGSADIVYTSLAAGNLNNPPETSPGFWRAANKARATVELLTDIVIADQIPVTVQDSFNLESALGVQLDVIGKYMGVQRNGYDFSGPATLSDDDFRQLIKIAIIQNSSKSALSDIQNLLALFFPGTIFVFDYENMRLAYYVDSAGASLELAEFFVKQGSLPKPTGVALGAVIYGSTIDSFFGFRSNEYPGYDWSNATTYGLGAVVEDPAVPNNLYVSLAAGNLNHAVTDTDWWRLLPFPVSGFSTNATGLQGRILTNADFL